VKAPSRLQLIVTLLGIAGLAFLFFLVRHEGGRAALAAIAAAGWGVVIVVAFHVIPLICDAIAWGAIFPRGLRPRFLQLLWMRWMGEAVSTVLPTAQVGGDIVRARLAAINGAPVATSAASVLVDITLSIFAQAIFTVTGLSLLAFETKRFSAGPIIAGAAIALLCVGGFYAIQRFGIFKLIAAIVSKLAGSEDWKGLVHSSEALDDAVRQAYSRGFSITISASATMSSWVLGAGEVYIALKAMGQPATIANALILESIGQGIRAAMFLVPGAVGFQDGGYVGVGALLGIPGDAALGLALIRRARELAFGISGVVAWQIYEARRAFHDEAPASGTGAEVVQDAELGSTIDGPRQIVKPATNMLRTLRVGSNVPPDAR
jgi:putative membrane protein